MDHTQSKHISNMSSCDTKQLFYFSSKLRQLGAKIGTTASKSLQTCCWVRKISGWSYNNTFSTIYKRSINIWFPSSVGIGAIGNHSHVKWHFSSQVFISFNSNRQWLKRDACLTLDTILIIAPLLENAWTGAEVWHVYTFPSSHIVKSALTLKERLKLKAYKK